MMRVLRVAALAAEVADPDAHDGDAVSGGVHVGQALAEHLRQRVPVLPSDDGVPIIKSKGLARWGFGQGRTVGTVAEGLRVPATRVVSAGWGLVGCQPPTTPARLANTAEQRVRG